RGMTQDNYLDGGTIVGRAEPVTSPHFQQGSIQTNPQSRDEWVTVDSLHFDTLLRAGTYMGLQYSPINHTVSNCTNYGELIPASVTAIQKSPSWVRADLGNILSQLTSAKQEIWAGLINSTVDPYIDEVAFCVAHSSVQYLSTNYANPQLMTENAQLIYSMDADLPYVEVIDHGSSTTDDDYYTTTRYRRINADSTVSYVDVPRDIYYWYIVHPKITDEIPAYINPAVVESNSSHTNNIAAPPTGVFWRSFLYTCQDDTLPILRDALMNCQTVRNWNGAPGDAINAITNWIDTTISFTSNTERPHQPVRIYRKHFGRCGEHADYTAAAARLALIPCTSIGAYSVDHTWNEFWDEDWIHWEPVNHQINTPLDYENGWGWTFGSVFENRSDGFLTPVTPRYSQGISTINIVVTDSLQNPVDGARILLMAEKDGSLVFDNEGVTKNDGTCTFIVGEGRHYAVRADSPIGSMPTMTSQYLDITTNSVNGEVYNNQLTIPNTMPIVNVTQVTPPSVDPNSRIVVDVDASQQVLCVPVIWDDITGALSRPNLYKTITETGTANFQLMDPDNFMFYQLALTADAFNYVANSIAISCMYNVPSNSEWYASIDNLNHVRNCQYITGSLKFQQNSTAVSDPVSVVRIPSLAPNYPNPFNPTTTIEYQIPQAMDTDLSIYNIRGQKVRTLQHGYTNAGTFKFVWDGLNENGGKVSSGVYFYRLDTAKDHLVRKMVLMK
ncbi:MAG TPA: FlgD immunoglobulin-like domain containing protein, partial [Candidatus Cloacimonadota bacterium]|nr:FlgD immunoglobulin-like domain containing protein [Candidatus Cloacimonadota bacterium]